MSQESYSSWCYERPVDREPDHEEWTHCRKQKWCGDREWECEPWDRCKKCCDPCEPWNRCKKCCDPCEPWDRCKKCCDPCEPRDRCHKWDENKKHKECEKCERDVNICTSVNIWQKGEANGGDANGGDGGDANGGSAAAAFAESEGEGDASTSASVSPYRRSEFIGDTASANQATVSGQTAASNQTTAANQASTADQTSAAEQASAADQALAADLTASLEVVLFGEGASAVGGDGGNGGNGGAGGVGGAGGTVDNTAVVTTVNVLVFSCDKKCSPPALALETNDRKLNINMDENGDTFVNGRKMEETALDDGTKVLIFRDSEVKK